MAVTNNTVSKKVLATVAKTLYLFTEKYRNAKVIATGSTEVRTRLYRIGIANNLASVEKDFIILWLIESDWEAIRSNTNYQAFSIRRKL